MDLYQEFKKQQDLSLTTGDVQVKNEGTGSQLFVDQSGSATIAPEVLDCVMEWKCLPIHSIYDQRIWTRSAWIFRIEGILSRTNQIWIGISRKTTISVEIHQPEVILNWFRWSRSEAMCCTESPITASYTPILRIPITKDRDFWEDLGHKCLSSKSQYHQRTNGKNMRQKRDTDIFTIEQQGRANGLIIKFVLPIDCSAGSQIHGQRISTRNSLTEFS